jgi:hypothetical protein
MSYKKCSGCGKEWDTIADIVTDHSLRVNGYQACFGNPDEGAFLLTHTAEICRSTLAIRAGDLRALYEGPEYHEIRNGKPDCPKYCRDMQHLETCESACGLHWIRVVLQYLIQHELPQGQQQELQPITDFMYAYNA